MYLGELELQYLLNSIRSVCNKPIFIFDPNWNIILCTHKELIDYGKEIAKSCASGQKTEEVAKQHQILLSPCVIGDSLICYFVILDKNVTYMISYLKTLISFLAAPKLFKNPEQTSGSRSMLINQLVNTTENNSEFSLLMKEFQYSYHCPRCAFLFEISRQKPNNLNCRFDASESYMEQAIISSSLWSQEDIYGFLNSDRYLIFKDMNGMEKGISTEMIHRYVFEIKDSFCTHTGVLLHCSIGSSYQTLEQLRQSYLEALFLMSNYEYLNSRKDPFLDIHSFVFEYAASHIPKDYWHYYFRDLAPALLDSPFLAKTAAALSREDMNLSQTALSLGIHRNTLLQRFAKLKESTGLSPLDNDIHRMSLRVFSLYNNQKITLEAGIVIQPNSVLHQGMQRMADLVYKNSSGDIRINIHTLSVSGNNSHLFEILRSGSIDMVAAATGVMNPFTDDRSKILDIPFLFHSSDEAKYILNTVVIKELEHYLNAIGVICLNIWSMGWRYLTSKTPIHIPSDLSGKKVRVMFTETLEAYYRSMGAIPIKMNYGDVKGALRSGIADCQENPYSNILGMKFYEDQNFLLRLKYYLSTEALYLSLSAWKRLNPFQQKIIKEAAMETTDWIFTQQQNIINPQCKRVLTEEKGMKIIEVAPSEEKVWRSFAQKLYSNFPHQDLIRKIEKARKEYEVKYGCKQNPPVI